MAAAFSMCKRSKWHFPTELCTFVWEFVCSTNIACVLKVPFWHLHVFRHSADVLVVRGRLKHPCWSLLVPQVVGSTRDWLLPLRPLIRAWLEQSGQ